MKTFGSVVRDYRKKSKLTIKHICRWMGISTSYLIDIETGKYKPPNIAFIHKYCKIVKQENDTLVTMAEKELGNIELYTKNESQAKRQLAINLGKVWDTISHKKILELNKLLKTK